MWRLRNRLIVTYTFIGVIPLVLVLMMALIAGYLFAGQFATFLATSDLNSELRTLEAANSAMATELATVARVRGAPTSKDLLASQEFRPDEHMKTAEVVAWYHPPQQTKTGFAGDPGRGQRIELYAPGGRNVGELPAWLKDDFQGIVRDDARLYLRAVNTVSANGATLTVLSSMPVDGALLERIAGDIGEVTIYPGRRIRSRAIGDRAPEVSVDSGDRAKRGGASTAHLGRLAATPEPAPRPRSHFLRSAGNRRLENRGDGAHPVARDHPAVAAVRAAVPDHGGIWRRHLDAAYRSGHCFRNNRADCAHRRPRAHPHHDAVGGRTLRRNAAHQSRRPETPHQRHGARPARGARELVQLHERVAGTTDRRAEGEAAPRERASHRPGSAVAVVPQGDVGPGVARGPRRVPPGAHRQRRLLRLPPLWAGPPGHRRGRHQRQGDLGGAADGHHPLRRPRLRDRTHAGHDRAPGGGGRRGPALPPTSSKRARAAATSSLPPRC